ncbi:response regulator [Pollutimonas subterranea]|nr:response regulator [Pollutimonas subterranea]
MSSDSSAQASAAPTYRTSKRPIFGLAFVILFFIITGTVSYLNITALRDESQRIQDTHSVIFALEKVFSTLQDAETGQRGFLLTGKQEYLAPYNSALAEIGLRLDRVEALTSNDANQQVRVTLLRQHAETKLNQLKVAIDRRHVEGPTSTLDAAASDRGKAAMDAIRTLVDSMGQEQTRLRQSWIDEMAKAYRTAWITTVLTCLIGVLLTLTVGALIRRETVTRERQQWLESGQARLASAMLGDQGSHALGESILSLLVKLLGAQGGALFVEENGQYRRIATDGVPPDAKVMDRFSLKEGLLGRVAADRESTILSDIPDGYLTIGSALGQDKPRHLLISPAVADDIVHGVIELGFFHPVGKQVLAFLDEASASIGTALRSAQLRTSLQNLLEETQRQSEELQAQSEELRVSNEELEERGRALQESQGRLEQQQAELEQTNSQLEQQAQQLEAQRDILERSNAAVALKARELERASRYKSDFLANMSHELRTPLNSLLILSKLLGDNPGGNLTEEQVKYAYTIQSSGNDLLTLINDILDLAKIEAGHVQVQPGSVSLEGLGVSMRHLFQPVADERGLRFSIHGITDCPPVIDTDRQRLEQILKNLLSNAFKFTEAGSVELSMSCDDKDRIAFTIIDSGIGIVEDKLREIFEAFQQADSTIDRKYGGTGLGLSISRELARLLGGRITVSSKPGEGSRFTLSIPLSYDPALVSPRPQLEPQRRDIQIAPKPETAPKPKMQTRKIADDRDSLNQVALVLLVVEDDNAFSSIVRDLAHEMGFQCLVAASAEEALDLAAEHRPHAVVLDVGLPDQSGLAVLDQLKGNIRTRHIPVHVVSAHDHAHTALSLGAIGYLVKPVKREELARALEALAAKLAGAVRRVLIVEDDPIQREAVSTLLASGDVETVAVGTAAECLERLRDETFDCMVLDLTLPDTSGFALLEKLSADHNMSFPPVIVYTGHDLSADDEQRLRRYSDSIIIKGARSPERLLDEVSLFLHQVVTELPPEHQKMIQKARGRDALLEGRRILVVEDDVRNIYSLTNILEPRGASIEIARNGREAIAALDKSVREGGKTIDLVLMDVMMPVMDGLTATREIRKDDRWKKLPIITLTAKAMSDDQQRCIDAGANDYMAKPLDVDKLLSLVRVWMPR